MEEQKYYYGKLLDESDFKREQDYRGKKKTSKGKEDDEMPVRGGSEPYKNFNFVVELDGISVAGFLECTGLDSETGIIYYREGNDSNVVRKLPGLTEYSNIILSRGVTDSRELYEWRMKVINGNIERKNGSIVLLNDNREEVARWSFVNGWPCRMSGPALNALEDDIAIEELEICHEGFERV